MLVWAEVWGKIICDRPIQCNDIRDDGGRNENAGFGFEGDERRGKGRDIDGNSLSLTCPAPNAEKVKKITIRVIYNGSVSNEHFKGYYI